MNWFDWILIGILAVLFVLALRHVIRQVKKGRCCGCSGCEDAGDPQKGAPYRKDCAKCADREIQSGGKGKK